jgi:ribonuclease D
LAALRAAVGAVAETHKLPTENLLAPDHLRRIAWTPPDEASLGVIEETLAGLGARQWQIDLTAEVIAAGLAAAAAAVNGDPGADDDEDVDAP